MYLRGLYGRPGGCDRLKRTIVSHGNGSRHFPLIASAADDAGFGDGSLAARAALASSSLSSSLASRPILATAAWANSLQERNAFLASARKSAIDSLDRLTSQLEETLDDIAADISQADPGDGLV